MTDQPEEHPGADAVRAWRDQQAREAQAVEMPPPQRAGMKTFTMYRRNVPDATHNGDQKNAPDQPQFEGVQFSDGSVAIRWLTAKRSTAVWSSMEDMLAIHGHPEYGSELVWHE